MTEERKGFAAILLEMGRVLLAAGVIALAVGMTRGVPSVTKVDEAAAQTCSAPVPDQPTIRWVSQEAARALWEEPGTTFVDARSEGEFQSGHVSGALHAPMTTGTISTALIDSLRASKTVVVYCDTSSGCGASTRLANLLGAAGLIDVRVLEGGMPSWDAHAYPAQAGACQNCP